MPALSEPARARSRRWRRSPRPSTIPGRWHRRTDGQPWRPKLRQGLALYDVDGEAATRSLLVLVQHVAPGRAHGVDGLVERDEVPAVAAQGDPGGVDRGDGGDRVPLDARHLDQAADRVASQAQVV